MELLKEIQYFFPMSPVYLHPDNLKDFDKDHRFIGERKKNGWRCLAIKTGGALTLWTRHKTIIHDALPLTRAALSQIPDGTAIDGELIDRRTKDTKDTYYAFDCPIFSGLTLFGHPWSVRRQYLEKAMEGIDVLLSVPVHINKSGLYDLAIAEGDEGIVLKRTDSKYAFSTKACQKVSWIKIKQPEAAFKTKEAQ